MLNALKWILHEDKLGCYTYKALMALDIARVYYIFAEEVRKLETNAGKMFVKNWKGPTCKDFKRQIEHMSLIPQSIVCFILDRLREGLLSTEEFNRVAEFHVQLHVQRGGTTHVQILNSILDNNMEKRDESCFWMVDCRCIAIDEGP